MSRINEIYEQRMKALDTKTEDLFNYVGFDYESTPYPLPVAICYEELARLTAIPAKYFGTVEIKGN